MAYKVKYTEQAEEDLDIIVQYFCEDLQNPISAERFLDDVDKKIAILRDNPLLFPLHHDKRLFDEGYRFSVIGNYLMFYAFDEDNEVVHIIKIVHGGRDIPTLYNAFPSNPFASN